MKHSELETKAMRDELSSLRKLLYPYVEGKPYEGEMVRLSHDDTDRQAAEDRDLETVEKMDLESRPAPMSGAEFAELQEDQRIRRDAVITRQGHKRLMQGCLETAWRRARKLEKELEDSDA